MPSGTKGGGDIAIAPDGSSIIWATEDTSSVWYSTNLGKTWAASTGIGAQAQVVSDRVQPGVYYGFSNGALTVSTDGGATFTVIQSGLPARGALTVLPEAQGDLWLSGQESGLYSNSGTNTVPALTAVAGIQMLWLGTPPSVNGQFSEFRDCGSKHERHQLRATQPAW